MTALINEARKAGITLLLYGGSLKVRGNQEIVQKFVPELKAHKPEIIEALKAEQESDRLEDYSELYHEQAGKHEYQNNLSRDEAEKLAVRTVWHYVMKAGDHGKLFSNDLTYDEARHSLEHKFQRKVSDVEFISAMATGYGFVAYRPEIGETAQ